jgi:hypothetical protein
MQTREQFFREQLMASDEPLLKQLQDFLPSLDDTTLNKLLDMFDKYGVEKTLKAMNWA